MTDSRRRFLQHSLGLFTGVLGSPLILKNAAAVGNQYDVIANENVEGLWRVETMELDIAENLIPLVDKAQGGDLVEHIGEIRRKVALDLGILLPPVRIRDDTRLSKNQYVFRIRAADVGSSIVYPDRLLVLKGDTDCHLEGIDCLEPVYGLRCVWISGHDREEAEAARYKMVNATSVLATHLCQIIKQHASDLLTLENTVRILEQLKETEPTLVEAIHARFRTDEVHKILKMLLKETISIRDMTTILETMVNKADHRRGPLYLTESVRIALASQITESFLKANGPIAGVHLDAPFEVLLRRHVVWEYDEAHFNLPANDLETVIASIRNALRSAMADNFPAVIVTSPIIRPAVWGHLSTFVRGLTVIGTDEIVPGTTLTFRVNVPLPEALSHTPA